MNSKSILIAAVLAVVLGIAGYFASSSSNSKAASSVAGDAFLPGLYDKINEVTGVRVKTSDGSFNVRRDGDQWTLVEQFGYPVQVDKVRSTLIGLAELKIVEEKTGDPAHYSELGVQSVGGDPDAEFQSKELTLSNAKGEAIASVLVGKPRSGGRGGTFYMRRATESPSWLVKGKLPEVPDKGTEWLDKKVLEVQREQVRAARIVHADGQVLTISKADADTNFTVHEMPEGRELSYASAPGGIAGALQYLNFEDVTTRAAFEAPEEPLSVSTFWTKDGLRITATLWEKEEAPFAAFEAAYDMDGAPTLAVGPMPEAAEGKIESKATPRPEAEVKAEVAELNARLSPWVFKLPAFSKTNLTKRVDALLKPLPEATTPDDESLLDPGASIDIDFLGGTPDPVPMPTQDDEDDEPEDGNPPADDAPPAADDGPPTENEETGDGER